MKKKKAWFFYNEFQTNTYGYQRIEIFPDSRIVLDSKSVCI
ncbi:hypothetical protein ACM55H_01035 [Flavobacterium sp. ZT3R17]